MVLNWKKILKTQRTEIMSVGTKTWLEMKWEIWTQGDKNKTCIPFKSLAKMCTKPQLLGKYMFLTKRQPLVME